MTVAKARRQLTKQINHDVSIYPIRRPDRDGTHFLPPNTPKDSLMGSIQIIDALRFFQQSLVRNMKLYPDIRDDGLFCIESGVDDADTSVKEGGITRQYSLAISVEIM